MVALARQGWCSSGLVHRDQNAEEAIVCHGGQEPDVHLPVLDVCDHDHRFPARSGEKIRKKEGRRGKDKNGGYIFPGVSSDGECRGFLSTGIQIGRFEHRNVAFESVSTIEKMRKFARNATFLMEMLHFNEKRTKIKKYSLNISNICNDLKKTCSTVILEQKSV